MLNIIWISFFLVAFGVGLIKLLFYGDADVFVQMMRAVFEMAELGFEISLGLVGVMAFWLGIMKVGERSGVMDFVVRLIYPLLHKLFPEIPPQHPAFGAMVMNISANLLGLDNAATPLGLKAMKELQSLNPEPERASNSQILFLVINTSSVTLFPVTIFTYRAQQGAADPTDVFIPILIATFCSTLAGLLATAFFQKINLLDKVIVLYLGGMITLVAGMMFYFIQLDQETMRLHSSIMSNFLIFLVIVIFICGAAVKRVNAFEAFIEGAKDGFKVAVTIIPYLVAILVGIGVFRASGSLEFFLETLRGAAVMVGFDARFIDALPTAMIKPLSGSGARSMMIDAMNTYGADSFTGRLTSIMQGSTETTFYVLALYFGAVGIRRFRHAVACGLIADVGGILAAIFVCYLFFG